MRRGASSSMRRAPAIAVTGCSASVMIHTSVADARTIPVAAQAQKTNRLSNAILAGCLLSPPRSRADVAVFEGVTVVIANVMSGRMRALRSLARRRHQLIDG